MKKSSYIRRALSIALVSLFIGPQEHSFAQDLKYWSAKLESADALYKSGMYKQALDEYVLVAENTASTYAQFQVAWIYHVGLGVPVSCRDAVRWYTLAANRAHVGAQNNLYSIYSTGCVDVQKNMVLAVKLLIDSAAQQNPRAMANLAALYRNGDGVEKDEFKAFDYANRSAKKLDPLGLLLLSGYYLEGVGAPRSPIKSMEALKLLATVSVDEWNEPTKQYGQLILGKRLITGDGGVRDVEEAYKWLTLAAAGSNSETVNEARRELDQLRASLSQSRVEQIERSIRLELPSSTTRLSVEDMRAALQKSMEENKGRQAYFLARELSNQNDSFGQYILGLFLLAGFDGVAADADEAYIEFRRSCQQGFLWACLEQAQVLLSQSRRSAALEVLDKATNEIPRTEINMSIRAASVYSNAGHKAKAEMIARKILIDDPVNKDALKIIEDLNK